MYSFKAYPSDDDFNDVASAQVKNILALLMQGFPQGFQPLIIKY